MATSYTTQAVTAQTRRIAYERLALLCQHMVGLGNDLISVVRNGDNTITITVVNPISQDQLDHLGIIT